MSKEGLADAQLPAPERNGATNVDKAIQFLETLISGNDSAKRALLMELVQEDDSEE